MKNVLVILTHPNIEGSRNNKALMNSISGLENVKINQLYKKYPDFKIDVKAEQEELKSADNWYCSHINYEVTLLKELGYGLNVDECAVTGVKKDLMYLSPKTGKAVSLEIGDPFKDKLFLLPKYFSSKIDISTNNEDYLDYQNCLKILNYFIAKFFKLNTHTIDTRERFLKAFEIKFLS
jgi:recombinational DNA repair protein (RecF pathway)